jgi:hemerythrin-like domain-containing protein
MTTTTDILRQQHREVQGLMKKLANGASDRDARVAELVGALNLHTRLEEAVFYPAIAELGTKHAEAVVLESYEEHRLVDFLMAQLPEPDMRSEQFQARLRVLQSLVEEHIEEEEREVFKLADRLSDERRARLDDRMAEAMLEVEEVDALLERAARAARRTERWAGSLLETSWDVPRRVVRRFAPSRWIGPQRPVWTARIVATVPRVVVDSLYRTVVGRPTNAQPRAA